MADQGEFCTECGAAVSSTDKFCAGCGHNLGRAIRWYDEAVRIDPLGPWRGEAAYYFEAIGRHDRAEELRSGQSGVPGAGG